MQELAATRLRFYHETLLYGSENPYHPVNNAAHNLANMHFIPTIFTNPARSALLYAQHACHRANPAACLPPNDTFYYTADMGLDTYVKYAAEQAHLLAREAMEAISVDHPARRFIKEVGGRVGGRTGGWVGGVASGQTCRCMV